MHNLRLLPIVAFILALLSLAGPAHADDPAHDDLTQTQRDRLSQNAAVLEKQITENSIERAAAEAKIARLQSELQAAAPGDVASITEQLNKWNSWMSDQSRWSVTAEQRLRETYRLLSHGVDAPPLRNRRRGSRATRGTVAGAGASPLRYPEAAVVPADVVAPALPAASLPHNSVPVVRSSVSGMPLLPVPQSALPSGNIIPPGDGLRFR